MVFLSVVLDLLSDVGPISKIASKQPKRWAPWTLKYTKLFQNVHLWREILDSGYTVRLQMANLESSKGNKIGLVFYDSIEYIK